MPVAEAIGMAGRAYDGLRFRHAEFSVRNRHIVVWGIVMRELGMPVPPGELSTMGFQQAECVDLLPREQAMEGIGPVVMEKVKHPDLDPGKP